MYNLLCDLFVWTKLSQINEQHRECSLILTTLAYILCCVSIHTLQTMAKYFTVKKKFPKSL